MNTLTQGQMILQEVLVGSQHEIDLSAYTNGMFLAKIASGDQSWTGRLVVNR